MLFKFCPSTDKMYSVCQQGMSPGGSNHGYSGAGSFTHDKLDWLKEENRKYVIKY